MTAISGIIRAGKIVQFHVRTTPAPEQPLRNTDVDFIHQRDRMQYLGEPAVGNCINYFWATHCRSCGDFEALRALGKQPNR